MVRCAFGNVLSEVIYLYYFYLCSTGSDLTRSLKIDKPNKMLIFVTIRCLSILSLMGLMGVGDEVSQGNHYASHQYLFTYIFVSAFIQPAR